MNILFKKIMAIIFIMVILIDCKNNTKETQAKPTETDDKIQTLTFLNYNSDTMKCYLTDYLVKSVTEFNYRVRDINSPNESSFELNEMSSNAIKDNKIELKDDKYIGKYIVCKDINGNMVKHIYYIDEPIQKNSNEISFSIMDMDEYNPKEQFATRYITVDAYNDAKLAISTSIQYCYITSDDLSAVKDTDITTMPKNLIDINLDEFKKYPGVKYDSSLGNYIVCSTVNLKLEQKTGTVYKVYIERTSVNGVFEGKFETNIIISDNTT